mgnify:CR=1 FL=1
MKNRTVIGIICIVIAVATTFLVSPVVNRLTNGETSAVRLSENVKRGSKIGEGQIEEVKVKSSTLPNNVIKDKNEIIGKYASADLFSGDYLTKTKLSGEANTAADVLSGLNGSKVAVSFTIDSFAAGLSGKLENGDIISIIVTDKEKNETVIPAELTYVRVITTTTPEGIDKDAVTPKEDGTTSLPSTITVLVNTTQAKLIAKYESDTTMQAALVYHGDRETAEQFIAMQDQYF